MLWKFSNKKYCLQKFIQKNFLLSTFIQKGLQKFIKSFPNWIQIPADIYFIFLCCHQGISVPRMTIEIRSYLSVNLTLLLICLLNLLQPPKWNSRSSMHVTRCHAHLQPSTTPHMSTSHLHVKHSNCTHAHKQSLYLSNHPIISCSSIHHSLSSICSP
jgi:hypothetical protein